MGSRNAGEPKSGAKGVEGGLGGGVGGRGGDRGGAWRSE